MTDCVFCRIMRREIPAEILFEDDHVISILDINPIHHGHALIIPKRHCRDFLDLPEECFSSILGAAKKIVSALQSEFHLEGYNLFSNNGKIAGQSVFHFHLHVTPRYANDNIQFVLDLKSYARGEMPELADRLRASIANQVTTSNNH